MKPFINNPFLLPALIVSLNLILAGRATAQTLTNLHSFSALDDLYSTNSDGAEPTVTLILSGNILYGTASQGGIGANGSVFKVNRNGSGFTNLYSFTASSGANLTNSDGANPSAVILSGSTLYGAAAYGGTNGSGTLFKVNTDGIGFTNLHTFNYSDSGGDVPGNMILSGNTLYGAAAHGGTNGSGTLFKVSTDGTGFTNLHSFTALDQTYNTNSDGAYPVSLVLSDNTLYGTANQGGGSGNGAVFKLNTDGTGFTNLYGFTAGNDNSGYYYTNSDGARPVAVVLSGKTLYGTAEYGGTNGTGTLFALNTDGSGFTNLHIFAAGAGNSSSYFTNRDGESPGGIILSGNTLYGAAEYGGTNGSGTLFALNTDGGHFTIIHGFTAPSDFLPATNSDGKWPVAGLILSGSTLYGTALEGGSSGYGTVFSLTLPSPPPLTITPFAANVILSWPTNATGFPFTLQATTNLVSQAVWTTVSPASAVVGGQNTVTNPISGTQRFYRLSQ